MKEGYINYQISKFMDDVVIKSEYVREMDVKASFIIRQLFKAYFNNFEQLPDRVLRRLIYDVSDFLHNNLKNEYIKNIVSLFELNLERFQDYKRDIVNIFYLEKYNIRKEKLINISNLSVIVKIMNEICSQGFTKKIEINNKEIDSSYKLGNIFIINIASYISEMTDSFAIHEFEKLYSQNC